MPSKKPHRRSQVERREQTKAVLMKAALECLIEKGYSGFSASGVAFHAGVSRGAQENYYPKKSDLIAAATDYAMGQAILHARQSSEVKPGDLDAVERFLQSSQSFFLMPAFMAMTEIMIAARNDKMLAAVVHPIIKQARQTLDQIWKATLVQAGYSEASSEEFIGLTHLLLRGAFYVNTWTPYRANVKDLIDRWRSLAPDILKNSDRAKAAPRRRAFG